MYSFKVVKLQKLLAKEQKMRGKVLLFDINTRRGVIEDKNRNRYDFHIREWLSEQPIVVGDEVTFEIPKEEALNVRVEEGWKFLDFFSKKGKGLF